MKVFYCEQLEQEWWEAHCGRVSASHAADLLNFVKSGDSGADRKNYMAQKLAEILTGRAMPESSYVSPEMQFGLEHEGDARTAYSLVTGTLIERVGYVLADDERFLCSPDGFVDKKGILEIKVPKTSTHLKWMLDSKLPDEHLPQCRFALMVCKDRDYVDFVSFDPRLPKRYQLFVNRLMREDAEVPAMYAAADLFMEDLDKLIARLNEIAPPVEEQPVKEDEHALTDDDIRAVYPQYEGAK